MAVLALSLSTLGPLRLIVFFLSIQPTNDLLPDLT